MPSNQGPEIVIGSMGRNREKILCSVYLQEKIINSKQKQDTGSRDQMVKTNSTKTLLQAEY